MATESKASDHELEIERAKGALDEATAGLKAMQREKGGVDADEVGSWALALGRALLSLFGIRIERAKK